MCFPPPPQNLESRINTGINATQSHSGEHFVAERLYAV